MNIKVGDGSLILADLPDGSEIGDRSVVIDSKHLNWLRENNKEIKTIFVNNKEVGIIYGDEDVDK